MSTSDIIFREFAIMLIQLLAVDFIDTILHVFEAEASIFKIIQEIYVEYLPWGVVV